MTEELCTVEAAAEQLKLHNKTVLRFIREGRLRATKIGKQYRILRSDLDAFAGVGSARGEPLARVTAIVDVPDVDGDLLRRITSTTLGAGAGNEQPGSAISIDVAHDPVRRAVKVVAVGTPSDVAALLTLVNACLEA
ncbi:helix-turn-helix domain-containing protein [Devosia nitrariae]|uniref:MerR family transcriptional regulator n=1 Tax=Devosia nitrariae TaxID=2071872 RepID=A0ABQ5WBY8_9HYPH|nr:helix-turn-helix domain-containing protein [Devosia nitrariae]GLQ57647.1 MerR family transcriptional regulator [Devosia nitrariae]